MKLYIKNFVIILTLLLIYNCGFKVVDEKINNFSIVEVKVAGEKRINFKIKNNLQINTSKDNLNILKVQLNTKKNKSIKQKNKKNEITKYNMEITTNVTIDFLKKDKKIKFDVSAEGDYSVADNYSQSLNNEKQIIELLVEKISKKVLNEINVKINDL